MGTHHAYETFPAQKLMRSVRAAFPGRVASVVHGGRDLFIPAFDPTDVVRLEPSVSPERIRVPSHEPVILDIDTPWDIAKHAIARTPVSLGVLTPDERRHFTRRIPTYARHVLDMPIKFPGTDVRIPRDLASFAPVIQRIIDVEHQLNPRAGDYYAYLSIHQGEVPRGTRQREMPAHVDGFQGARWVTKHAANHSYLVCDELPTVFYPRAFPLDHVDITIDDVYAELAQQIAADPHGRTWKAAAHELVLMDAYCVHRGIPARTSTFRTWLQLSWETRMFDRLGNTHNPHFSYAWTMVPRDPDPRIRVRLAA